MCPCVKSGTADIVVARPGAAKPERFKTLQSGSYFGEMALLSDEKRSASVVAKSEGLVVFSLTRAEFAATLGARRHHGARGRRPARVARGGGAAAAAGGACRAACRAARRRGARRRRRDRGRAGDVGVRTPIPPRTDLKLDDLERLAVLGGAPSAA